MYLCIYSIRLIENSGTQTEQLIEIEIAKLMNKPVNADFNLGDTLSYTNYDEHTHIHVNISMIERILQTC